MVRIIAVLDVTQQGLGATVACSFTPLVVHADDDFPVGALRGVLQLLAVALGQVLCPPPSHSMAQWASVLASNLLLGTPLVSVEWE
jgi:hypothetical protein